MLKIESEREDDGRWIAEVPALPGVLSPTGRAKESRGRASRRSLCALLRTGSRMVSRYPTFLSRHPEARA
jgi:hypothetical protein